MITLKPLEAFLFGGKNTFGVLGDEEDGTYIVKSNPFPSQTALLGMLQHEVLKNTGLLTRKRRGEWVDKQLVSRVKDAIGNEKFDLTSTDIQEFGAIRSLSSVFLVKEGKRYIKKADTTTYKYIPSDDKPLLIYKEKEESKVFSEKKAYDLYDNYVCLENQTLLRQEDIFIPVKQVGNHKTAKPSYFFTKEESETQQKNPQDDVDNAYFKKISYQLKKGFNFAFYLEYEPPTDFNFPLSTPDATFDFPKSSLVTLGADRGMFRMQAEECTDAFPDLCYEGEEDELVLLSDSYINLPVEKCATFTITSEVETKYINRAKKGKFNKSETYYLYEKGSVFIKPTEDFIEALNNQNLQNIGFNHYSHQEQGA